MRCQATIIIISLHLHGKQYDDEKFREKIEMKHLSIWSHN